MKKQIFIRITNLNLLRTVKKGANQWKRAVHGACWFRDWWSYFCSWWSRCFAFWFQACLLEIIRSAHTWTFLRTSITERSFWELWRSRSSPPLSVWWAVSRRRISSAAVIRSGEDFSSLHRSSRWRRTPLSEALHGSIFSAATGTSSRQWSHWDWSRSRWSFNTPTFLSSLVLFTCSFR